MIVPRTVWNGALATALLAGSLAPSMPAAGVEGLDAVVDQRVEANQKGAQSQERIDKLADDTEKMTAEYRGLLKQIAAVRVYNRQIDELITSQQTESVSLQAQIDEVEQVGRQVTPLMLEMIQALDLFVKLDSPFLAEERQRRIAGLKEMMTRADVTDAERFRRILEAYQIENE
jgi:small-conductance mechanosensitive channel